MNSQKTGTAKRYLRIARGWFQGLGAGGIALLAGHAADFSIHSPGIDATGRFQIQLNGAAETYAVLYRGTTLGSIGEPVAVQTSTTPTVTVTDSQAILDGQSRFYRVRLYTSSAPTDVDNDGINDWLELQYPSVLNPLNSADALLDFDRDGRSNLEEALAGTNPTVADQVLTRVESSPSQGAAGISVTREIIWRFSQALAADVELTSDILYAEFGSRRLLTRIHPGQDRRSATLFFLEPVPASARICARLNGNLLRDEFGSLVDADGDGKPGGVAELRYDTMSSTLLPGTGVSGYVYDSQVENSPNGPRNVPLEGVIITVDGSEQSARAVTDANGFFRLSPCPSGRFFVHIDGRPAVDSNWPDGAYYPFVGKTFEATPGHTNTQPGGAAAIYLPRIPAGALKTVSPVAATPVEFSASILASRPELAGVRISIPPNALFADNGTRGGRVGIAPVPSDRLPSPLPPGLVPPIVITIQTDGGSNFDQPVPVQFPNLPDPRTGQRRGPGEKTVLWSFNHDSGNWEPQGTMTISADGNFAISDPGVGILQPGWHAASAVGQPTPGSSGCGLAQGLQIAKEYLEWQIKELECMGRAASLLALGGLGGGAKAIGALAQVGATAPGIVNSLQGMLAGIQSGQSAAALGSSFTALSGVKQAGAAVVNAVNPASAGSQVADLGVCLLEMAKEQLDFICAGTVCLLPPGTPGLANQQAACNAMRAGLTAALNAISAYKFAGGGSMNRLCIALDKLGPLLTALSPSPGPGPNARTARPAQTPEELQAEIVQTLNEALVAAEELKTDLQPSVDLAAALGEMLTTYTTYASAVDSPTLFRSGFHANAYYVLTSAGISSRGRSTALGTFDLPLISLTDPYYFALYDPVRNTVSEVHAPAPGFGSQTIIPDPTLLIPGLNDLSGDRDQDGLTDLAESVIGTRPDAIDSDGDGVSDLTEVRQGQNPLDGLSFPLGPVAAMSLPGTAKGIAMEDTTAFVAMGPSGLAVVDLANPLQPILISQLSLPGDSYDVAYSGIARTAGLVAFASDAQIARGELSQIHFVDLSDTLRPRLFRTLLVPAKLIEHHDGLFYVAVGREVRIFDAASGLEIGGLMVDDLVSGLHATESELLVTTGSSLSIFSRQLLGAPQIGRLNGNFAAADVLSSTPMVRDGDRLWVGTARGLYAVDLSDRTQPRQLNQSGSAPRAFRTLALSAAKRAVALTVVGANGANLGGQTSVFDIADETSTNKLGFIINGRGRTFDAALMSGWVILADGNAGLTVLNVLSPDTAGQSPTIVWSPAANDIDPSRDGVQMSEGQTAVFRPQITDDVEVATVELLLNGEIVDTTRTIPAILTTRLPLNRNGAQRVRLAIRCHDRGGNSSETEGVEIELLPDVTAPLMVHPSAGSGIAAFRDAPLVLRFSEPLVDGNLPLTGISLVHLGADGLPGGGDDTSVPMADARAVGSSVSIWPANLLAPGRYQLTLARTSLQDAAGNGLATDLSLEVFPVDAKAGVAFWVSRVPGRYHDAANWLARRVPGQEDVVISLSGGTPLVTLDGGAVVRSLLGDGSLAISRFGSLTIRESGSIQGTVTMTGGGLAVNAGGRLVTGLSMTGGSVTVIGQLETRGSARLRSGAEVDLDGPEASWIRGGGLDAQDFSLLIRGGAVAEFAEFSTLESDGDFSGLFPSAPAFQATGANSRLRLPNLTTARGPIDWKFTGAPSLNFAATDGGVLDLPQLTRLTRRVRVTSDGFESRILAPQLTGIEGPPDDPFPAFIRCSDSGQFNAPLLATTTGCDVQLANLGALQCQTLGIDADRLLRGNGIVAGHLICEGSLLADQASGVLRIEGDLTLSASAIYSPTIGSVFGADSLAVTGTAHLSGKLKPLPARGAVFTVGESFEVGQFSGAISGAFAAIDSSGMGANIQLNSSLSAGRLTVQVVGP